MSKAQQLIAHAARLLDLKGDVAAAEQALRDAMATASAEHRVAWEAQAMTFLGELLLKQKRHEEALALFRRVVHLGENSEIPIAHEVQICREHLIEIGRDIDRVISILHDTFPGLTCEQLRVGHPGADDDGLWFFRHPPAAVEVQLESSSGNVPFVVEGTDSQIRDTAHSIDEAVALVTARLGLGAARG